MNKKYPALALFLSLGSINSSHAMLMTDSVTGFFNTSSFEQVRGPTGSFLANFSSSYSLFDPNLGTLASIDISINGSASMFLSALFEDGREGFETRPDVSGSVGTSNLNLLVAFPGFSSPDNRLSFPNESDSCSKVGDVIAIKAECRASAGFRLPFSAALNSSDTSVLANYIGLGSRNVLFQQEGSWSASDSAAGQIKVTSADNADFSTSGTFELVYTYTPPNPVPVPAAAWLFGSALIGIVGFSKRRKAT